jgi:hypothetical protein
MVIGMLILLDRAQLLRRLPGGGKQRRLGSMVRRSAEDVARS